MSSGDREVAVEMIGPRRLTPRLAPGEEASDALAAVSRACRLTILWRDAAAIVVRYPRRWVRLELELRILGAGSSPGRSGSARRRRACEER
jgi:hypothetical protein